MSISGSTITEIDADCATLNFSRAGREFLSRHPLWPA
jgi:hypothetical protein